MTSPLTFSPSPATAAGGLIGAVLVSFHWTIAAPFREIVNEFCVDGAMPLDTRLAISPWAPIAVGLIVIGLSVASAFRPVQVRWAPAASITLGVLAFAGLFWGLCQPIFALSGMIKPD